MDDKALAKSKRAHSQQNSKKHHPKQKSKAPSGGTTENDSQSAKKPLGKQVREKPSQSRGRISALPSNWDRYEEENNSGLEESSASSANKVPDVVLPKSKGADYGHLITEAQSHSEAHLDLDTFPSMDDLLPGDFGQAVGSLLSVKAEGILSWIGDDNFVVDDKRAANREAPFLSLNLHAIAEQLAKIDLSQRLFVEADLLPLNLATHDDEAVSGLSEESSFINISEKIKVTDQNMKVTTSSSVIGEVTDQNTEVTTSSTIIGDQNTEVTTSSTIIGDVTDQNTEVTTTSTIISDLPDPSLSMQESSSRNYHRNKAPDSTAQSSANAFKDTNKKQSEFEAANAEAELDMLLDSFSDTKILDSSSSKPADSLPLQEEAEVSPFQLPRKGPDSLPFAPINLDDDLDDLLNASSGLTNQSSSFQPEGEETIPCTQFSSNSGSESKVLDDFDSWLDTL